MLFQVHWQNQNDLTETLMVSQNEFTEGQDSRDVNQWAAEVVERRRSECPEGWWPLICDENYEGFWWKFGDKIGPKPSIPTPDQEQTRE